MVCGGCGIGESRFIGFVLRLSKCKLWLVDLLFDVLVWKWGFGGESILLVFAWFWGLEVLCECKRRRTRVIKCYSDSWLMGELIIQAVAIGARFRENGDLVGYFGGLNGEWVGVGRAGKYWR